MSIKLRLLTIIMIVFSINSFAQTVTGTVIDKADGLTMPGVDVLVKGTTVGVTTDFDGNFSIDVPEGGKALEFSFMGYLTKTVAINGLSHIKTSLEVDAKQLDDVVVVGYGTQKKVNLTGAVSTVDSKVLENRPTDNILKSLQGQVPGVTIINRPNGPEISIRGRGTFGGSSSPLYVIDGMMSNSEIFSNLDPTMIESVTFLKDASSAAIYGAKAAYGVVLVTTKSGGKETKVSYSGIVGTSQPTVLPNVVNSADYARLWTVAENNSGINVNTFQPEDIQKYEDGSDRDVYPNTNWFDLLLDETPIFTRHSLNISGKDGKIDYMFGGGYQRNESLTKGGVSDRYNVLTKVSVDVTDWFKLSTNINYFVNSYETEQGGISYMNLLHTPPTMVAQHSNGNWGSVINMRQATADETKRNPLRNWAEGGRSNNSTKRLIANLKLEFNLMEGMKFTNMFSMDSRTYSSFSFNNSRPEVPSYINPGTMISGSGVGPNKMSRTENNFSKYMYDGWFNYSFKVGEKNTFSTILGTHSDFYRNEGLSVGRNKFPSNDMNSINGGSTDPADQVTTSGGLGEESNLSFFGRASYDYDNRYLAEVNLRADGSSRFNEEGRWGYFPSVSIGWRVSQEGFMSNLDWMDLKLRASWGKNGNTNNTGLYDTYSTFDMGTIYNGGIIRQAMYEGIIGNSDLTWEETSTTDIGLDYSMFNGLLSANFDYYNRVTQNILVSQTDVLAETGISSGKLPKRNVGEVVNKGFELGINHSNQVGDWFYSIGANASLMKNEITSLGKGVDRLAPSSYWINQVGDPIGSFFMYEADGLYSVEEEANGEIIPFGGSTSNIGAGSVKLVDQNGDGVINEADRKVVGKDVPHFTYGLNLNVEYKGFSLSVVGQGVEGTSVYLSEEASQMFFDNSTPRDWQRDYWTPTNQGARYPKLYERSSAEYSYNNNMSSYWLFDSDYFRIKNITLGYKFPKSISQKVKLDNISLFVSADNMFTIRADKRMKDFEVERSSGRGVELGTKTFTFGVNLSF